MTMLRTATVHEEVLHDDVCSIRIGEEWFALRLADVLEVTTSVELHACPLSPPYIAGLMQYRGEVLAAVCLRLLLGMQPSTSAARSTARSVVMVGARGLFALLVDGVGEVLSVATSTYEPVPATVELQRQALLSGVYKLEHGLLPLLDARCLEPSVIRSALGSGPHSHAAHLHTPDSKS